MRAIPSQECRPAGLRRRGLRFVGALLFAAAVAAFGWMSYEALTSWTASRAARRTMAAGRFSDAEEVIRRWLAARPSSVEAHYLLAQVAIGRQRPQEAIEELARARSLGYPVESVDRLEAIIRAHTGRYAESEPVLRHEMERATAPDPEVAEALARIYLETYRFQAAAAVLEQWIQSAPGDPKPFLWKAEVSSRLGGLDDQVRDYREALTRDPHHDQALLGLARVLRESGRFAEAQKEYSAYLARNPDDPAAQVGAGLAALGGDDVATAANHLDSALEKAPDDPEALDGRARVALRQGEIATALAWLDRAARLRPYDPAIRYHRGTCLARLGRREEARAEQEAADRLRRDESVMLRAQKELLRDPTNIGLQAEIARWMLEHGHETEGLRWARKILGERPGHPETNRLMADYYQSHGQPGLANYHRLQSAPSR
jgi:tetratricopeptide (TPR) repeat protein